MFIPVSRGGCAARNDRSLMKLIVSQLEALRRYVSREFYTIQAELITNYGWSHIDTYALGNAPTIERALLDSFGRLPDAILFWEGYDLLSARAIEIGRLRCRKVVFADDLHYWNEEMRRKRVAGFALCEMVLSTYGYAWGRFYPEFCNVKKAIWVPHSASPDFMLPYNEHSENAILLSGAINHHYPLRQQMKALHDQRRYSLVHHPHPGYHCAYDYERNGNVGRGYAERLNKYRVGFTDALTYGYVVAKHFEIPATGALLLADAAVGEPLREIGFVENEHYIPVSSENLEERLRYVLDEANHRELDVIRRNGQALVWEKHKTSDRARQINDACES